MGERDRTMNDHELEWCENEDLRHAYHRTRAEMIQHWKREWATGKTPIYFLEAEDDWTPVPMDRAFWQMVMGGLDGLRRYLARAGVLQGDD
ncbi:MAG: hypothetical protein M3Y58_08415 [Chloroflexota bacterium]|nr:hypothetical protein [Chloroflexota bacterium]